MREYGSGGLYWKNIQFRVIDELNICKRCVLPDTRPGLLFDNQRLELAQSDLDRNI